MWPPGNQPGSFAGAVGALNYAVFFLRLLIPVSVPSKGGSPQSGGCHTAGGMQSHPAGVLRYCHGLASPVRYLHL